MALRATVTALGAQLATAQAGRATALVQVAQASALAEAAAAESATPARGLRWVSLDLPMVRAAIAAAPDLAAVVVAGPGALDVSAPALASATTLEIDLRDVIARADLVLAALPEAALLDPKLARDQEAVDAAGPGTPVEAARRIA